MTSPATADAPAGVPDGTRRPARDRDDRPAGVARTMVRLHTPESVDLNRG